MEKSESGFTSMKDIVNEESGVLEWRRVGLCLSVVRRGCGEEEEEKRGEKLWGWFAGSL